jgi:hypothetical protein
MSKELTIRIRMPESMSPRQAAAFVREALDLRWKDGEPDIIPPRWNIAVYQTFDFGTHTEHRKVKGRD